MGLFDLFKKKETDELGNTIEKETTDNNELGVNPINTDTDSALFQMIVDDVFYIAGRGMVVTGVIKAGSIRTGDKIIIVSSTGERKETSVAGIEIFRKILDRAEAGDKVGILLKGVDRQDCDKGDMLIKA